MTSDNEICSVHVYPALHVVYSLRYKSVNIYCMEIYVHTGCPKRNVPDLGEGVPYVKVCRYNPKHLYPKLNGYGDNGQRSLKL